MTSNHKNPRNLAHTLCARMKIEYLPKGSMDCPLIRIYYSETSAIRCFHRLIAKFCNGELKSAALHELPGFQLNDCLLCLTVGVEDQGVQQISSAPAFTWVLTPARWCRIAELIEPFTTAAPNIHIHQWLAGREARQGLERSPIAVVLSNSDDGRW